MLILVSTAAFLLGLCSKDDWDIKFCGEGCPSGSPWRVESLDLGLPCFPSQEACLEWAASHGYGDKPCIRCD